MLNAYIYEGTRTPFGRYAGTLAKVRPDDLLAGAIKAVLANSKFKAEQIEDIVVGCANQAVKTPVVSHGMRALPPTCR